jgi:hypothetical protein
MRPDLSLREKERFPGIKASMDVFESTVFPGDLDDPSESE